MSRRLRLQIKPNLNAGLRPSTGTSTSTDVQPKSIVHSHSDTNLDNAPADQPDVVVHSSPNNSVIAVENTANSSQNVAIQLVNKETEAADVDSQDRNLKERLIEPTDHICNNTIDVTSDSSTVAKDVEPSSFDSVEFLNTRSPPIKAPVLTSLLSSPSKYRSRFQARPNLHTTSSSIDSSNRHYTNFDESDHTISGPIVGASTAVSQKVADTPNRSSKRRFDCSQQLDRSLFTMADLIYWNPENGSTMSKDAIPNDDKAPTSLPSVNKTEKSFKFQSAKNEGIAAPQVRVNADGSIVVDETSLTLQQTKEDASNFETVRETNRTKTTRLSSASFRRNAKHRPKMWNKNETEKFYRYLKMVGTNFLLMAEFFPKRHRDELKNKYRRECKNNPHLIDDALMGGGSLPAPIPKCLRRLQIGNDENENELEEDDDEEDDDNKSIASRTETITSKPDEDVASDYEAHSSSESEEDIKGLFKKPTRFGRQPKPVKYPDPGTDTNLSHIYGFRRRQKFATKVVNRLKNPKPDPVPAINPSSLLTTPGPSTFPKYLPGTSASVTPPMVPGFGPDTKQHLLSTNSPGQQLLLVHEKSKDPGKPDLVHVYLVSSPSTAASASSAQPSVDLHIPSNITSPEGNITNMPLTSSTITTSTTTSDDHKTVVNVTHNAADIADRKINLTIRGNQPMEVDLVDETPDVVLIDI